MSNKKLSMEELQRISVKEYKSADKTPVSVILDNVRSMSNIGSIFRTADAFRLESLYLCGITATPPHREINKTALGATESVDWLYMDSTLQCVEELRRKGYKVFALEQTENSIMLQHFSPVNTHIAIVLGNEVDGVQQEVIDICDGVIEIPQFGTKHSFNVSVSCGIMLWEIVKKIKNL